MENTNTLTDEQLMIMNAGSQYRDSLCADCAATFTHYADAETHGETFGHSVIHSYQPRPLN